MVKSPTCSCPLTTSLFALLGKKWIIFILHAVAAEKNTFTTIRTAIGEANTKILTDRLGELVAAGILSKDVDTGKYHLTEVGSELTKKLDTLAQWWGGVCPTDCKK